LSIAESGAQRAKLETGMLHPKLRSRNITCREGRSLGKAEVLSELLILIRLAFTS